jgi:chromosome partitioning protein
VRTIAVLNQKGGVGKTTTVANLGAALASRGHEVALIDMDPQAHLTLHLGIEPGPEVSGTYDLLADDASLDDCLVRVDDRLRVVPSVIDLAAAEVELAGTVGREQILRDKLLDSGLDAEFLLIDCPPSLGLLSLNALAAAGEVVIPLQPHFLALQGLGKLLETVGLVRRRINPGLVVSGVILCMYESNTRLAGEVQADLEEFLAQSRGQDVPWSGARVFRAVVRRNIKLAECPSHGRTIFDYDPASRGAEDYNALADEFLQPADPGEPAEPAAQANPDEAPATEAPEPDPAPSEGPAPASGESPGEPVGEGSYQAEGPAGDTTCPEGTSHDEARGRASHALDAQACLPVQPARPCLPTQADHPPAQSD